MRVPGPVQEAARQAERAVGVGDAQREEMAEGKGVAVAEGRKELKQLFCGGVSEWGWVGSGG